MYFGIQSYTSQLEALGGVYVVCNVVPLILREGHWKSTLAIYEMFITIQTLSLTDSIFITPERLNHTNKQWK